MIRSEKDFLDNVLGAIYVGRQAKADSPYILEKIEEMVRNRLLIYSGQAESGVVVNVLVGPTALFVPVKIEGKPLSEMIIEDRR